MRVMHDLIGPTCLAKGLHHVLHTLQSVCLRAQEKNGHHVIMQRVVFSLKGLEKLVGSFAIGVALGLLH